MSRVVIRVALDPAALQARDKATIAMQLANAADSAAPTLFWVESYAITDTLVHIKMQSGEHVRRLRTRLKDNDRIRRLRARLADLGGRSEFEIEDDRK